MHDHIIGLYERTAAAWDQVRSRSPFFERVWLDRFIAELPAQGTILDIGCGSGEPLARYFVESGFAVTGIDSSPSMIARCTDRFPGHRWFIEDMRHLSLGRRFDGVIAWHSFFHLKAEDQRPMFARFAAHTAPGGVLMFTSGPAHGEAIGEWQGDPLYHASLAPAEYRTLLADNGFSVLHHRSEDPDCGDATVWLARKDLR